MGPCVRRDDSEFVARTGPSHVQYRPDSIASTSVPVVQHVFAEIALGAIGFRLGPLPHDVAVLAAGDIGGRAGLTTVGTAIGIIVVIARGRDRLVARRAGGE